MDTAQAAGETSFDLVVIGGGPGGYGAALYATSAGLESPSSRWTSWAAPASTVAASRRRRSSRPPRCIATSPTPAEFGIESSAPVVNFATAQARKQKIVDGIVKSLTGFMKSKKITILDGIGSLGAEPHRHRATAPDGGTTTITGTQRGARRRLGAAHHPRLRAVGGPIMTSDEVLMLDHVPARVAVIGGGAIGCEFASTFADLGSQVTILEGLPKILPGLDTDVANVVVRSFKKKNIDIRTGVKVHRPHARTASGGTAVHFGEGEQTSRSTSSSSASAAARSPTSSASRAPRSRSPIAASSRSTSTAAPASPACTPSATSSTRRSWPTSATPRRSWSPSTSSARARRRSRYDRVPWAIYCHPEVAFVGPSEEAAKRGRPRRGRRQAPVPRQQPGPDPRRARRAGEDHRQEATPTAAPGRSSACTWSARGSPSS